MKADIVYIKILEIIKSKERVLKKEALARHTSFKIGGPAEIFVIIESVDELKSIIRLLEAERIRYMLIGNGSDLLFDDEGYDGVILKLSGDFEKCSRSGDKIIAGAGRLLSGISNFALKEGLSGMENISGIPGTIGGAVFMNAGSYGTEMKDIVDQVYVVDRSGKEVVLDADQMEFSYRNSIISHGEYIVTKVVLKLEKKEKKIIEEKMAEVRYKRNEKQPLNYPSAGSTFKRPQKGYAAALIDQAGLKGLKKGGAEVSEKHAGFVINKGMATSKDVISLMKEIRSRVYANSGILLEPEVKIIPFKEGENFEIKSK